MVTVRSAGLALLNPGIHTLVLIMDVNPTEATETAPVCYRHPARATRLSCTTCDKPICIDCAQQGPVGQKCPDCAKQTGRARVINARQVRGAGGLPPVVLTLLVVTVAAYLGQQAIPGFQDSLLQSNRGIRQGEWWRLLTAAFLHGSVMHLGFNMYALYLFGPNMERRMGSMPFATLYVASALAGGAAFLIIGPANGAALGASGAVFGLFGAWIGASFRVRNTPAGAAQFRSLAVLLGINLLLPFILPNVAWQAHLGGLAAGLLIVTAWMRLPQDAQIVLRRALVGLAVAGAALAAAFLA